MPKIAIQNTLVFDGEALKGPETVRIDDCDGTIGTDATGGAEEEDLVLLDGSGCTLLPGLIDSHVHVQTALELDAYGGSGPRVH
ncbi:hypothetical protein DL768_002062 [Monosporascus sp. mg162]|nr:hypothetical protein DL768_002062 [Monosporascus sp. mg162]